MSLSRRWPAGPGAESASSQERRQRGLAALDAGLRERDDDPKERALAETYRRIGAS